MIPVKLRVVLSILLVFEKEALYNPNLIRSNSNITIRKVDNKNINYANSNLNQTYLSLYEPKFAILNATSVNSRYNLDLNVSNPLCRETFGFSYFDNYVSNDIWLNSNKLKVYF